MALPAERHSSLDERVKMAAPLPTHEFIWPDDDDDDDERLSLVASPEGQH